MQENGNISREFSSFHRSPIKFSTEDLYQSFRRNSFTENAENGFISSLKELPKRHISESQQSDKNTMKDKRNIESSRDSSRLLNKRGNGQLEPIKKSNRYAHVKSKVDTNLERIESPKPKPERTKNKTNQGNKYLQSSDRRIHSAVVWRSNMSDVFPSLDSQRRAISAHTNSTKNTLSPVESVESPGRTKSASLVKLQSDSENAMFKNFSPTSFDIYKRMATSVPETINLNDRIYHSHLNSKNYLQERSTNDSLNVADAKNSNELDKYSQVRSSFYRSTFPAWSNNYVEGNRQNETKLESQPTLVTSSVTPVVCWAASVQTESSGNNEGYKGSNKSFFSTASINSSAYTSSSTKSVVPVKDNVNNERKNDVDTNENPYKYKNNNNNNNNINQKIKIRPNDSLDISRDYIWAKKSSKYDGKSFFAEHGLTASSLDTNYRSLSHAAESTRKPADNRRNGYEKELQNFLGHSSTLKESTDLLQIRDTKSASNVIDHYLLDRTYNRGTSTDISASVDLNTLGSGRFQPQRPTEAKRTDTVHDERTSENIIDSYLKEPRKNKYYFENDLLTKNSTSYVNGYLRDSNKQYFSRDKKLQLSGTDPQAHYGTEPSVSLNQATSNIQSWIDSLTLENVKKHSQANQPKYTTTEDVYSRAVVLPSLSKKNGLSMSVPVNLNKLNDTRGKKSILKRNKAVRIALEQNRVHCYTPEYDKVFLATSY
ncbi:putative uncharacterized protein DDB_G0282133 [Hydractinia symbiolongicarpus]|uniref:putative uncharacterized protein DDB_G0282133 n=1 Tax=Hydractinia symbiolongicarpus TaxID=13093 RepID=UPI00254AF021|nr:putative uncharacterized protein DDB_G0282133 [Hydractinia symbiolongicarpus]